MRTKYSTAVCSINRHVGSLLIVICNNSHSIVAITNNN